MSNISTIIDALRTNIPLLTGFNTKTEICNVYSLKDNPVPMLENGWGLRIGPAAPSSVVEYARYSESREMRIVLTRLAFRTEDNAEVFSTTCKSLLEDALLLKKFLDGPLQFNAETYVVKVDFQRDSGLSFLKDDNFSVMYVEAVFTVDICENW